MPENSVGTGHAEIRKLAAIMFTDMVGFSRQMGADEARMLRLLDIHNQLIQHAVTDHHGHVIKIMGDAFLVDFPSIVHAVQCAQRIQAQFRSQNAEKEAAEQIHVRIGIHSGDIVQRDGDVFGEGVNIASRLQTLAEPDSICISQVVYKEVEKKLALGMTVSLGRPKLKGIAERFPVYALFPEPPTSLRQTLAVQWWKLKHKKRAWQVVAAALAVGVISAGTLVFKTRYFPAAPQRQSQESAATGTPSLPLPDKPSIVVLPFVNMSKDPDQDYFSDGLTDVLTGDLSKISSLFVIARNSAFTYKGKAVKVQDVGREMGVRYVLKGSVLKAEGQVRITAQLIDATTGYHLWAERYDRPLEHILRLQDEVVQKIVTTLGLQLTVQEQGYIARKHTDNLEAYDYWLRAVEYFYRFTKEAHAQARQMSKKAIGLDPQYAEAYVGLGWTYCIEWAWRWSTDPQNLERALALAQQALALDDSQPAAHSLLSEVYAQQQQYDQAIAEGERAIALDPNNGDSYYFQADALNFAGRPEEALQMAKQAMRLNPRYPHFYPFTLGLAYRLTGRYTEAIAALKETLSRNPNFQPAHFNLALIYVQQWAFQQSADAQTLAQALAEAQRIVALNDSYSRGHFVLGYVYLWQKQYEQAMAEMERAIALDPNLADGYAFLADTLSRIGRSKDALVAAAQALRLKSFIADWHLDSVGTTYDLARRTEEAIVPLQQFLNRYPNILGAHLTLAAVYSELGKEAEARAEAAEVLRINPQFALDVHKQRVPIKDPAMLERHIAALRKAGLK